MARLPKGMKLTKNEVSQEFDLEEIFGVSFSGRPGLRDAITQAFIDAIIERSESGKDRAENDLPKYKRSYIESDDFKDFNKSPNEINMTLRGDMLDSMDKKSSGGGVNNLKIGFKGKKENNKAFGLSTGMKGKKFKAGKRPSKRDFFGLTAKQIGKIKSQFKDRIEEIKRTEIDSVTPRQEAAQNLNDFISNDRRSDDQLFNDIFGGSFGENN